METMRGLEKMIEEYEDETETRSKFDYCLKCPEWGGDGICLVQEGAYDNPNEDWCIYAEEF